MLFLSDNFSCLGHFKHIEIMYNISHNMNQCSEHVNSEVWVVEGSNSQGGATLVSAVVDQFVVLGVSGLTLPIICHLKLTCQFLMWLAWFIHKTVVVMLNM